MELLEALLLGILQGITEFIPVSSSGHLVLAQAFLGQDLDRGITFEIVVHFGSFCSIALYYREKLWEMIKSVIVALKPANITSGVSAKDENVRLSLFILLSMIPAGIVGFTMKDSVETAFANPFLVSCMLLVTGAILFSTRFMKNLHKEVNASRGFLMGIAQAMAIMPGISRSGSTIVMGLFLKMKRDDVANFSFLMLLPILAGAMFLEMMELRHVGVDVSEFWYLFVGFLASFVTGYYALKYLIILLKREQFHYFAFYCWAMGLFGIFYFM
jgi:undecaprenyl-diphosphatase